MAEHILAQNFPIKEGSDIIGSIVFDGEMDILFFRDEDPMEPNEVLTVRSPQLPPTKPAHTIVKSWSEHLGLAQRLQEAGVGTIISHYPVGNFDAVAYLLKLNLEDAIG